MKLSQNKSFSKLMAIILTIALVITMMPFTAEVVAAERIRDQEVLIGTPSDASTDADFDEIDEDAPDPDDDNDILQLEDDLILPDTLGGTEVDGMAASMLAMKAAATPTNAQAANIITFDIPLNENGETVLYLPEGKPVTDADLLLDVSAADENDDPVTVTVKNRGGLDMQNPVPKTEGYLPQPYIITYAAIHPVIGEITATREVYVTLVAAVPMALLNPSGLTAGSYTIETNGIDVVLTNGTDSCVLTPSTDIAVSSGDLTLTVDADVTIRSITVGYGQLIIDGSNTLMVDGNALTSTGVRSYFDMTISGKLITKNCTLHGINVMGSLLIDGGVVTSSDNEHMGITVSNRLTIQNGGTLTTSGNNTNLAAGEEALDVCATAGITVDDGSITVGSGRIHAVGNVIVNANGSLIANNSVGSGIVVTNGNLQVIGGTVTANSNAQNGVYLYGGNVTVKHGGTLTANSNRWPGIYIESGNSLTIDGGTVAANLNYSNGIWMAGGDITVKNGGTLTANMNTYPGIGVASGFHLTIDNGAVTANDNSSNGIWMAGGNIAIENGGSLTTEGNIYNGVYAVGSVTVGIDCKLTGKNTTGGNYASGGFTVDGVMIGYGTAATDIYSVSGGTPTISNTGIIIAVDSAAAALQTAGTTTGLKSWQMSDALSGDGSGTASWALENGKSGVTNSVNGTFVELTGFTVTTSSQTIDGNCGATGNETNVQWSYDSGTKILTITGTGAMADYASADAAPWYAYASGIETVNIQNGVTNIGNFAFRGYTTLTTVSIANSVTTIGNTAFRGCTALTLTALPDSVTTIGDSAFNGCGNLALTALPSGVTAIGTYAFYNCTKLTLAALPNGLTTINTFAFYGCTGITLATLPSGITSIGNSAFYGCTELTLTALPDGVTIIGNSTFYGCTNLALTALPDGVTSLGTQAFYNCTNLALTALPDEVTTIGDSAFRGCTGLTRLELPASVTTIGSYAFRSCSDLTTLVFRGIVPTVSTIGTTFDYMAASGTLYYPSTTDYSNFTAPSGWTKTPYTVGVFTAQPMAQNRSVGETATFSVVGSDPILPANTTLQWQVFTANSASWNDLSGANSDTLILTNVTMAMNNSQYRCVATNDVYLAGIESSAATLMVTDPLAVQPNVTFTVTNTGGSTNLQNPADLIFAVDNAAPLAGYIFLGVRFMNVTEGTNYGQTLYSYDSVIHYVDATGTLTIQAAAFGQHSQQQGNSALTPGTYRAEIQFWDGTSFYFDYYTDFELTSSHTISAAAGSGGGISPSGTISVNDGGSQTFIISPNRNYSIRDVTVDGTSVGAQSSYTFNNVAADHIIHATFYYSGGSGSGGGSSSSSNTSSSTASNYIVCNTIHVPYSITGGSLTSSVAAQTLRSIVDNAYKAEDGSKTVKLSCSGVSGSESLTSLTLSFDASSLKADENVTFIIETPFGVFLYTTAQMLGWFDDGFGTYTVTLEKSSLKVDVKKGGESATWNNLTPMARIGIPYPLETEENTAALAVTDMNGSALPTSMYENGMVYADIFTLGTYQAGAVTLPQQFVENVISSRDAEGWSNTNNDLNKYVYYNQNGSALTGWQTIGGNRYHFGSDGVMHTGWLDLDDTWYYFYEDGTLAVSTIIDGDEVGADGAWK